jgi:hypothetical protein
MVCNTQVLQAASKQGKYWFAAHLANKMTNIIKNFFINKKENNLLKN